MDQQDIRSEDQWRNDVKRIVSETGSRQPAELSSVCIFRVPKCLVDINREAYVPQVVSLGPLHWKTLPTQMHDHKAESVRKMLRSLNSNGIDSVVGEIRKLDKKIRSCYDEVIKCDEETLALMMTLDGCFLLEFFWTFICNANPSEGVNFEPISIFAAYKIEFLRGYMVLRDIMMLENQIPLCVLVKLLQLELKSSEEDARQALCDLAYKCLMSKASPFKIPHDRKTLQNLTSELKPRNLMEKSKSLLDFWRRCLESFLKAGRKSPLSRDDGTLGAVPCGACIPRGPVGSPSVPCEASDSPTPRGPVPREALDNSIPRGPVPRDLVIGEALDNPIPHRPGRKGKSLDNPIPRGHVPRESSVLSEILVLREVLDKPIPSGPVSCGASEEPIPSILSARNLKIAGIEIKACERDSLNEIRLVNKGLCGAALFLPQLLVTDTTEIVIRNVMALEECRASPPNPISRYIELMDNLIDAPEDVCLLRKNGVIDNRLGSEEEVVALFNSLCKGISSKSVPEFDDMLKQVKKYYDGKWNIAIAEFVQKNFSSPLMVASFVVAILIVLMTGLQTCYTVYSAYQK